MNLKELLRELNKLSPELDEAVVTIAQNSNPANCETDAEKVIIPSCERNYILICD